MSQDEIKSMDAQLDREFEGNSFTEPTVELDEGVAEELEVELDAEAGEDTLENFAGATTSSSRVKSKPKTTAKKKKPAAAVEPAVEPEPEPVPVDNRGKGEALQLFKKSQTALAAAAHSDKLVAMIEGLSSMNDQQVRDLLIQSQTVQKVNFVGNGAIAYEIFKRVSRDKKFMNQKGQGANSVFAEIATEIGVAPKTLYSDFRIFDAFGDYLIGLLAENPELLLPREFYSAAVKTENPTETLNYFEEKRLESGYTTIHAQRDVVKLNSGASISEVSKADLAERKSVAAGKAKPSRDAGKTPDELIQAVLRLQITKTPEHESYLASIVENYGSFEAWFVRRAKEEFGGD